VILVWQSVQYAPHPTLCKCQQSSHKLVTEDKVSQTLPTAQHGTINCAWMWQIHLGLCMEALLHPTHRLRHPLIELIRLQVTVA